MIPAFPPRPRRLRSLLLPLATAGALAGGLAYLVSIWPAPRPFVVPRDRPTPVTLVPVDHGHFAMMSEDPRCLAILDDLVRRPNWTVTIAPGSSGCLGDHHAGSLTVDADGDASWTGDGLPARPLHLSPAQISKLHAVALASCESPEGGEPGYSSSFIDVHWGTTEAPARRVRTSEAFTQLEAFVDDAVAQYRVRRLAERSDFSATVAIEPYTMPGVNRAITITFNARGELTIYMGRKRVTAETLDIATRVDAIDWIEMNGVEALLMPRSLAAAIDRATFDAGLQDD